MLFRLIFLLGLLFYPSTLAQSFHFGVLATNTLLIEPEIQISNLTFEDSKLSMRLAGGVSDPLEFGLGLRNTTTLGPLGNVIIMATANIKSDASFELVQMQAESLVPLQQD